MEGRRFISIFSERYCLFTFYFFLLLVKKKEIYISLYVMSYIYSHSLNCWDAKLVYGGLWWFNKIYLCVCVLFGFTVLAIT